jgi:serine/threonine protein kinase
MSCLVDAGALADRLALASPRICTSYEDLDSLLPPGGALAGRLFSRLLGDQHDDPPLAPGTRVGYWRIGGLLGCGGSSTVYLADRDDGHFEQQAALKVVRPHPRLIEQFRRERQILAQLRHPAIAQLIDGGEINGGRLWFAMEPVFGERIDHHVRNRRLPLGERLSLFEAVCDAVAYAHRRQLVHRDIKPGNLLVDETGRPRLLDFGIASTDDDEDERCDRAMTPIYASPEQHSGGSITAASDIYQLGALLRALVAPEGVPCETLPCKPRAIVRKELDAVIAHATETDPARRYPSATALCADIAALRERRRVSVIGGLRYPFARFFQRYRASLAIAYVGRER